MSDRLETLYLGKQSNEPVEILDRIELPGFSDHGEVRLTCKEFASFCPVTNQPDYGELLITYRPNRYLIETKSLKLFLWSFRDRKAFNEALVSEIADKIFQQIQPKSLTVIGVFHPRGGIQLECSCTLREPVYPVGI